MQGEALLNTLRGNRVNGLFTMTLSSATKGLDRVLFSLLDITEHTRLEKQTQEQAAALQRKRIALADIVETAVETVRPFVQQCRHSLSVSLPPNTRRG